MSGQHLTNVSESIEAKYWVSRLSFVNTSCENCPWIRNRWLKIKVTARFRGVTQHPENHAMSGKVSHQSWAGRFRESVGIATSVDSLPAGSTACSLHASSWRRRHYLVGGFCSRGICPFIKAWTGSATWWSISSKVRPPSTRRRHCANTTWPNLDRHLDRIKIRSRFWPEQCRNFRSMVRTQERLRVHFLPSATDSKFKLVILWLRFPKKQQQQQRKKD